MLNAMKQPYRKFSACADARAALSALLLWFCAFGAEAQTPTAEQLKLFQSLPADQRAAILQQMGAGAGKGAAVGASSTGVPGTDGQVTVQQPGIANADAKETSLRAQEALRSDRIKGGEQILIEVVLPPPTASGAPTSVTSPQQQPPPGGALLFRSPEVQARLEDLRDRIRKRNPYDLSPSGVLQLPGLDPIALAGLTSKEAQERLALDPALREFTIALTLLRVAPQGVRALKPYGYDIFRDAANALVPGTDIPVPDDYKVGPGDTMSVQLYGQQSQTYSLPVSRDGTISLPELGPIGVGGMTFGAARSLLEGKVRKQMIGTQARVALSDLKSARVLVLGDAERPGSYVVSGLSTATAALFASGGVKAIGSLRNIEIRRNGSLVRRLDLYDVLLRGDTHNDVRLETGDAVFVPPVGTTVGIDGAVRRPAIYELNREATAAEAVLLAGGLDAAADLSSVTVERIQGGRERRIAGLDLSTPEGRKYRVQDGDIIRIGTIPPVIDNGISLQGHLYRPGVVAYHEGIRLSDVIGSVDALKPHADLNYVLIRREAQDRKAISVFSADLSAALAHPHSGDDTALNPRDQISIFDLVSPRDQVVVPLLEEMGRQARPAEPMSVAEVTGRVNAPGKYPLEIGMRVSDMLRAGGGLQDAAYAQTAELTRYDVVDGERRNSSLQTVDIASIMRGDATANLKLQPYDVLTIKQTPEWGRVENVVLRGEVQFPGIYRIRRGETLSSVLKRAGGLTATAFAEGAVFTREELKLREREQLDRLADRLQADIAVLSLQASATNPSASESVAAGRSLLDQLRATKPIGRLVIDLAQSAAAAPGSEAEVMLRSGDELVVPLLTQEVTVLGEVQSPTSHLYRPKLRRDDVISLSGGVTARADKARIYIVRADGSVVAQSSSWMGARATEVRPGDTVIVPFDAEKMRPLPMWTAITTIIYNLAIAATAIGRL